jgi:hypothetical protein
MFGERKVFTIKHLPGEKAKPFLMDGYNCREAGNDVEPGWISNYQGFRLGMIPFDFFEQKIIKCPRYKISFHLQSALIIGFLSKHKKKSSRVKI